MASLRFFIRVIRLKIQYCTAGKSHVPSLTLFAQPTCFREDFFTTASISWQSSMFSHLRRDEIAEWNVRSRENTYQANWSLWRRYSSLPQVASGIHPLATSSDPAPLTRVSYVARHEGLFSTVTRQHRITGSRRRAHLTGYPTPDTNFAMLLRLNRAS